MVPGYVQSGTKTSASVRAVRADFLTIANPYTDIRPPQR
jgi:hypothetical protein